MRTTLVVPDALFARAKSYASRHRKKLSEVFSESVAEHLARAEQAVAEEPAAYRVKPRGMGKPRVDINDREALFRAMEEER